MCASTCIKEERKTNSLEAKDYLDCLKIREQGIPTSLLLNQSFIFLQQPLLCFFYQSFFSWKWLQFNLDKNSSYRYEGHKLGTGIGPFLSRKMGLDILGVGFENEKVSWDGYYYCRFIPKIDIAKSFTHGRLWKSMSREFAYYVHIDFIFLEMSF